jgi:hypothetical protein
MLTLAVPTCYHANLVSRFVEIPHLQGARVVAREPGAIRRRRRASRADLRRAWSELHGPAVIRVQAYAPSGTQPRREALRLRSLIRQSAAISYVDSPLNSATERSAEFRAGPQPGAVPLECPLGGLPDGSRRLWHSILPRPELFPKNSKPSLLPGAKSMTPKSPVSGAGEQKIPSAGVLEIDG